MVRPFRFGGGLFWATSGGDWADGARRLESLGYDTLLMGDHFSASSLSPVPSLVAAGLATTRLRVGCTVFDNDFRHQAALAREVATADVLIGGRFEFGFGAGWQKADYEKTGIAFDPPGVRVSRLEEALHIIKGLWSDGPLTFDGKQYQITNYDGQPKPLQRPHPPIFIGAGGKRLLSLAAKHADIVGLMTRAKADGSLERAEETDTCLAQKIEWVREAAGGRFVQLELALLIWQVEVTENPSAAAESIAARTGRAADQVLDSPYFLIGSIDAIVEKLQKQRERLGISYISVFPSDTESFAPVVARLAGR